MHDDRRTVGDRLRRVLDERVLPAVHSSALPLTVERWEAPGATLQDAVREGHWINLPERTVPGDGSPVAPLVTLGGEQSDQIVAETVKLADDRSGDVVVRLYEALGGRANALVSPGFPVTSVTETDLLERPLPEPQAHHTVEEAGVRVTLRPFQILTLRLGRSGER